MTRWNPNDPIVLGPEAFAAYDSSVIPHQYAQVAQRFRSNSAETINAIRLHGSITAVTEGAAWIAEIVAAGDEIPTGFTTVTYAPNLVTNVLGAPGLIPTGHGGFVFAPMIDEWPPDYGNGFSMGPGISFDMEFATAGFSGFAPLGRIASVGLEIVTDWGYPPLGTTADQTRRTTVSLISGGSVYGDHTRIIPPNNAAGTAGRYMFGWGEINPVTGQPWTQSDIIDLDSPDLRIRVGRYGSDTGQWRVTAIRLVITFENTDRILARGVFQSDTVADAHWTDNILLADNDGASTWAKATATDYTLVVRQADEGNLTPFGPNWLNLTTVHTAPGTEPPADLVSYDASVVSETFLVDNAVTLSGAVVTAWTPVPGRMIPFVFRTTAPATSADGQPYSSVRRIQVYNGSGATEGEIRISGGSPADYEGLRVMLGADAGAAPTAPLTIAVRRRSDGVVMATFTVDPEDLPAVDGTLYLVLVPLGASPFTLAAATSYYLDLSSTSPSTNPWRVGLLAVVPNAGGGVQYDEATYDGGTSVADPIRGSAVVDLLYPPADFAAVLDAVVDPPTGFAVTEAEQTITDPPPHCAMTGIPYADMTWTGIGLGSAFAGYRLQRLAPDGVTWQDIGYLTAELHGSFRDLEARLGVAESYRVRIERTDGAVSLWSDVETVTLPLAGCGYTFTSNELPDSSVGYADVYDRTALRDYSFPEAAEVQFRAFYGRDFQVAFHPTSRRGEAFDRDLLVAILAGPTTHPGPDAFDALRDLVWSAISYVCVRDESGNRWFANVRVPNGSALQPSGVHRVVAQIVETTATPSTPDQPAVPGPAIPLLFLTGDPFGLVGGGTLDLVD